MLFKYYSTSRARYVVTLLINAPHAISFNINLMTVCKQIHDNMSNRIITVTLRFIVVNEHILC